MIIPSIGAILKNGKIYLGHGLWKADGRKKRKAMKELIKKCWKLVMNREFITYGVAGVATTVVNFLSYHLFCNIWGIANLIANAMAWVVAVAFAYVVNAKWVFREGFLGWKEERERIAKFVGARVVTFIVEEIGMFVLVDVLKGHNLIMKAIVGVLVIILNYVFSKVFVFIRGDKAKAPETEA